ncbi:tRNA pseudouridine synthase [Cocos nucifera]|uniref:tRNA pseudouridine synthase n=1 Tax=Cocos nucifera TaxID=13894 RepID=A0A8K0IXB8_COCNU|nr:tRNA pseudouridine synthase [Cocos nucifera]
MSDNGGRPSQLAVSPDSQHDSKRSLDAPLESSKLSKLSRSMPEGEVGVEEAKDRVEEGREIMSQNPRIQRYLVAVEYIGTRFSGSQKQPNCRTVVGVLELPPHEPGVVRRAVNHFLQKNEGDIMVIDVRRVPADFHARFKALERTYHYRILSGPEPLSTFEKGHAWHVSEDIDILAMKKACSILVGCHDFSSFRAAGCQANSPIKTLDELNVSEVFPSLYFPSISERTEMESLNGHHSKTSELESFTECSDVSDLRVGKCNAENDQEFGQRSRHRCYVITARARSFLYHQVRMMVGVLKSVGTGDLTFSDVEKILNAKTIAAASPMAPACGLYLGNVKYDLP